MYMKRQPRQTKNSNIAMSPASTWCPQSKKCLKFTTRSLLVRQSWAIFFTTKNHDSTCAYPYGCFSVTGLYNSGTSTKNGPIMTRSAASNRQSVKSEWECVIHAIIPSATINKTLPQKDKCNILFSICNLSFFI